MTKVWEGANTKIADRLRKRWTIFYAARFLRGPFADKIDLSRYRAGGAKIFCIISGKMYDVEVNNTHLTPKTRTFSKAGGRGATEPIAPPYGTPLSYDYLNIVTMY